MGCSASGEANVWVNDPTPNITGVSPSPWNAGTNFTGHIYGSGFGTSPQVNITDSNGAINYSWTPVNDGQIDINVTIAGSEAYPGGVPPTPIRRAGIASASRELTWGSALRAILKREIRSARHYPVSRNRMPTDPFGPTYGGASGDGMMFSRFDRSCSSRSRLSQHIHTRLRKSELAPKHAAERQKIK
jgi:hypothetical protein